jgi:dihydrofolate reductase
VLIHGEIARALEGLKAKEERDLVVFGSGVLVQSLMRWNLVDEFLLLIHPLTLGTGRRLFAEDGIRTELKLYDVKATSNGVVVATYQPV